MNRLESHMLGIDQGDTILFSDFEHDGDMWTGQGPREVRKRVAFSEPYIRSPVVQVSVSMWDVGQKAPLRADIKAENIDETGFEIVFRTWGDSQLARIRAAWTSFGKVANPEQWDLY